MYRSVPIRFYGTWCVRYFPGSVFTIQHTAGVVHLEKRERNKVTVQVTLIANNLAVHHFGQNTCIDDVKTR